MSIDLFSTRTMLTALEQMFIPKTFLLDLFFKSVEVSDTEYVDIDIVKGKRTLAPFVSPRAEGKVMAKDGYTTKSFKPPYVKPKDKTDAQDLLIRQPGEMVYPGAKTPLQRAQETLGKDMLRLINMIVRREEWMAAQALNTGKIVVVGDGVDAEIDFGMDATHKITLTGAALWTDVASTPLANLKSWKQTAGKDSGHVSDVAVFGTDAINAFLDHADTKDKLNNRRIILGQIDPKALPSGATYYGEIEGLDIYSYDEWYLDDAGDLQPMVPVDKVWLGSTQARTARHYGAIKDLKALAPVQFFLKSWEQEDPSVRWLLAQSAPLVCPHEIDAFMSIKVV